MAKGGEFQEQVKQLGKLIAEFDRMPDGPQKIACRELVKLLMDVHGEGLEKMLQIVFESGDSGPAIIDRIGQDSTAGGLLLLYSLHPDDLGTRLEEAMERIGPRIRKLSCTAEIVKVEDGAVQVRVVSSGHSCGSSANDIKAIVEDGIYELAPDIVSLEILGLEEPRPTGFVALESLLGHGTIAASSSAHRVHAESAV